MTFEFEAEIDHADFVTALPMVHNCEMPAIEGDGTDSLDEVTTMHARESEIGRCFHGRFAPRIADSPAEEPTWLGARDRNAGYPREVALSRRSGATLERNSLGRVGVCGE